MKGACVILYGEAGCKVGLVVMLPMAVTSPQVESRVTRLGCDTTATDRTIWKTN